MGNTNKKEEQIKKNDNDIKINHEKFSHFVYHEPEDLIEITLEAESEKDINRWDQDLKRINSFQDKETLMVPNKH